MRVTWAGHSSFVIELGDFRVLTDPVWSERCGPLPFLGPKRMLPPGFPLEELSQINVVLITHNHYDHLDSRTIRKIAATHPNAAFICPVGLEEWLRKHGCRSVIELGWWDTTEVSVARITAVPAQHWSRRGIFDTNKTLWCGFVVEAQNRTFYFAGDSGYHDHFARIGRRFDKIDVAALPIGGYNPDWFMRILHMTPEDAAQAFVDLGAENFIAMHHATFPLTDEPWDEPAQRLEAEWGHRGLDPMKLWIPLAGMNRNYQ